MEQRINERLDQYITEWKNGFAQLVAGMDKTPDIVRLQQFMCDYERLVFTKEDLQKRLRAKLAVSGTDQCCAKSSNGQRCTRRRRHADDLYCGTHAKGTPYGAFTEDECEALQRGAAGDGGGDCGQTSIFTRDIQGIVYYVDRHNHVYQPEDILHGYTQPRIIGKCVPVTPDAGLSGGGPAFQVVLNR